MNSTVYRVELSYTRRELLALFDFAPQADVERGGRYDARSGALIVWSHGVGSMLRSGMRATCWVPSTSIGSPIGSGRSNVRRASTSRLSGSSWGRWNWARWAISNTAHPSADGNRDAVHGPTRLPHRHRIARQRKIGMTRSAPSPAAP